MTLVTALLALSLLSSGPAPLIQKGDRIALLGDSITEQKQYSRFIEMYLLACTPELDVEVRQYGWSGEQWPGMLGRLQSDVLRFKPTVATSCYGMNDHGYRKFETGLGQSYKNNTIQAVKALRAGGVRTILVGSPGSIGKVPTWVPSGTLPDMNDSLDQFSRLAKEAASETGANYADVHGVMKAAGAEAKKRYGDSYIVEGSDGVHPGGSGQLIMAYAFLKGMGMSGDLGTIQVSAGKNYGAKATNGHKVLFVTGNTITLESIKYPFVINPGPLNDHNSMASGASLVPFIQDLSRITLKVSGLKAGRYRVTWGSEAKEFDANALKQGINLAGEYTKTPFDAAFAKMDQLAWAKQDFETQQIKGRFRSEEFRKDADTVVKSTEAVRSGLELAIKNAHVPVQHTIKIESIG